jgi:hypothetical protein
MAFRSTCTHSRFRRSTAWPCWLPIRDARLPRAKTHYAGSGLLHTQNCAGGTRAARPASLAFKASDKAGSCPDLHDRRPVKRRASSIASAVNGLNAVRTIELIDAVMGHLVVSSDRARGISALQQNGKVGSRPSWVRNRAASANFLPNPHQLGVINAPRRRLGDSRRCFWREGEAASWATGASRR